MSLHASRFGIWAAWDPWTGLLENQLRRAALHLSSLEWGGVTGERGGNLNQAQGANFSFKTGGQMSGPDPPGKRGKDEQGSQVAANPSSVAGKS